MATKHIVVDIVVVTEDEDTKEEPDEEGEEGVYVEVEHTTTHTVIANNGGKYKTTGPDHQTNATF